MPSRNSFTDAFSGTAARASQARLIPQLLLAPGINQPDDLLPQHRANAFVQAKGDAVVAGDDLQPRRCRRHEPTPERPAVNWQVAIDVVSAVGKAVQRGSTALEQMSEHRRQRLFGQLS
jgi:hypothetical protein